MELLEMDRSFTSRSVNEGFSGGEKKRNEILQMAMLEPKYAVLDETDSGLDIDALKIVAHGVNSLRGPNLGILVHHALPAPLELHRARSRARHGGGADRAKRAERTGARTRREAVTIGRAKTERLSQHWQLTRGSMVTMKTETSAVDIDRNIGDFSYPEDAHARRRHRSDAKRPSITSPTSRKIPDWVREFRLKGLKTFLEKPMPTHWASKDLEAIDFDKIRYYLSAASSRSGVGRKCRTT